ncbi:PAAR domain-containing protein [Citrobacter freundii]|uniref:PAAR domain-containing protein n=1 Tax=Citrobacter freundii TaxID=546 RepID=UPI0024308F1B|nr:PAAR domain-containing protein [Citrobacter freundii]WFW59556.1 PAAR domain-containing protein [Citrobacter freundii]
MGIAYFLRVGDKTTCGGTILTGCTNHILDGQPTARHGDSYICGKDKKLYHIAGGQPGYFIHGVQAAGTAHSVGTCPCKCRFINSISNVSYFYESEVLSTPKPVTNRVVSVTPQNVPKPLTMAHGPYCPTEAEEDKPPRETVDAGFCVLPYEAKPSTYEPYIFVNPPDGTRELYHKLNPDMKKQPGSILIVVDPEKQDQQQIEALQKARDRIDKALAPLTLQDAKLLHDNRGAVDAFSYQLFGNYLGNAGDSFGYISEIGKSCYEEIKQILIEIQELYKDTYTHNKGIISGEEFFGQRARLFEKLNVILNKFSKTHLNLEEYNSIKKALGLSTSSIMHKWDKTGVDNIEGYAKYIENSAKLVKLMKTVGFVGIGLDFAGYTSNIYDACAKGRESACKKAAITEYSKFGFKQASSMLTGLAAGRAANVVCTWVLGLSTIEAGGVGAALCFATGVGVTIASGKIAEKYGEDAGEKLGNYVGDHIIYENIFH